MVVRFKRPKSEGVYNMCSQRFSVCGDIMMPRHSRRCDGKSTEQERHRWVEVGLGHSEKAVAWFTHPMQSENY